MSEIAQNTLKTRCFFCKYVFSLCYVWLKSQKNGWKVFYNPFILNQWASSIGKLVDVYLIFEKEKVNEKFLWQDFHAYYEQTKSLPCSERIRNQPSALCRVWAFFLARIRFFAKNQFFYL